VIFVGVREDLVDGDLPDVHPAPCSRPATLADALEGLSLEEQCGPTPSPKVLRLWHEANRGEGLARASARRRGLKDWRGASFFTWKRLSWREPLPTACVVRQLLHPDEPRFLSARAIARCASFPDTFRLPEHELTAWAVIGNSVPPALMEAIALKIKKEVLRGS
jgi:site-specific DNA-cytosine methylase